ncbi:MAG: phage virion morphogenesis protein [Sphingomonas sp.]|uniref:phage virion morphogenesis protein n=1 Tax=Sphingomonas sp. TaxID=28214 RepID=UPI0025CE1B3C|nr:phage virion morphogenesis protein [Sphingomonas sp.]MBX9881265.1 phage virion morphogenesis protein [Sphingomonas sp.]
MAGGLEFDISVDDQLGPALARAVEAAIDLTPAMGDIAGELEKEAARSFEFERSPIGVPWKPSRRAIEEGGQTLSKSGDLLGSLEANWGKDFAEAGPETSGGAGRYAAIHQFGGTIRPRQAKALRVGKRFFASVKIPARPYLGWNDTLERYAIDTLIEHIARAFRAGGEASA